MNSDRLSGADDVTRLEPLGALQQIEFHGFALVQRAIAVLLDGGKMNEDIFPGGALDKSIPFRPVEPLHCTLLSHNELLSPLLSLKTHILCEAQIDTLPPQSMWTIGLTLQTAEPGQQERLLSFAPSKEKSAQSSGACRGSASFDCDIQHINLTNEHCCRVSTTAGIILMILISGKRRIIKKDGQYDREFIARARVIARPRKDGRPAYIVPSATL
jgi:hypothetical protein